MSPDTYDLSEAEATRRELRLLRDENWDLRSHKWHLEQENQRLESENNRLKRENEQLTEERNRLRGAEHAKWKLQNDLFFWRYLVISVASAAVIGTALGLLVGSPGGG